MGAMLPHRGMYVVEYYSPRKKNEALPFATTWMNLEGVMLSEINQTEKDKYQYRMISHMWNIDNY